MVAGLLAAAGLLRGIAMPLAIAYSGTMMGLWGGSNVYQTHKISADQAKFLLFQEKELAYKEDLLSQRELEHNDYISGLSDKESYDQSYLDLATRRQLLDESEFAYRQQDDALDRATQLAQTQMIGQYDIYQTSLDAETRARIASGQSATDVGIYQAKMRQLELDANDFEMNKAMDTISQSSELFGQSEPMAQVAYILRGLLQIDASEKGSRPTYSSDPHFDDNTGEYSPGINFQTNALVH